MSAQIYPPSAGQLGSTAIYKDSSIFVGWANQCQVQRGWQDISTPSLGLTNAGDSSMACGKADVATVVSLGDGGFAICQFSKAITNGPGFDFAVFENSFSDDFLELAFVEVSSDGLNFFRFPSHSLSDTINQTGTFGSTDATKINNLAGKYKGGFGTQFDLQELVGVAGLNINSITHVKIIDVVGSLNKSFATYDSHARKINDPWPTPFPSGGFDLDAIGVIHQSNVTGISSSELQSDFAIYPNPLKRGEILRFNLENEIEEILIYNLNGDLLKKSKEKKIDTSLFDSGIYFLKIVTSQKESVLKLILD